MWRSIQLLSFFTTWRVRPSLLLAAALTFAGAFHSPASAQSSTAAPSAARRSHVQVKALPGGIQISTESTIMQITALRDDVLRVRATNNGRLPEDASWAVLPAARRASVQTIPDVPADHMGFRTPSLQVTCDPTLPL